MTRCFRYLTYILLLKLPYDSGASISVRAKQSARRRSKTYILLLLTNLLHRSSARQRRDETRAGPFRPTLTGAIPRPSVDFFAIRTGTPYPYPNLDPLDLALRCLRYLTYIPGRSRRRSTNSVGNVASLSPHAVQIWRAVTVCVAVGPWQRRGR